MNKFFFFFRGVALGPSITQRASADSGLLWFRTDSSRVFGQNRRGLQGCCGAFVRPMRRVCLSDAGRRRSGRCCYVGHCRWCRLYNNNNIFLSFFLFYIYIKAFFVVFLSGDVCKSLIYSTLNCFLKLFLCLFRAVFPCFLLIFQCFLSVFLRILRVFQRKFIVFSSKTVVFSPKFTRFSSEFIVFCQKIIQNRLKAIT